MFIYQCTKIYTIFCLLLVSLEDCRRIMYYCIIIVTTYNASYSLYYVFILLRYAYSNVCLQIFLPCILTYLFALFHIFIPIQYSYYSKHISNGAASCENEVSKVTPRHHAIFLCVRACFPCAPSHFWSTWFCFLSALFFHLFF